VNSSPNDLTYDDGAVISNVHVVPVFWGSDVNPLVREEIHCFYTSVVQSPYIDWLSEYDISGQNIGRGSVSADVTIVPTHTGTSLDDDDIQEELANQIDAGVLPPPDGNTLYMIDLPPGVGFTEAGGSCVAGGACGYHQSFGHNGQQVRYGVLPDYSAGSPCVSVCGGPGNTAVLFAHFQAATSHELMEAVTDPDPNDSWSGSNGEIGDPCAWQITGLQGTNYAVQLLWSNAHEGCFGGAPGTSVTETPVVTSVTPAKGPWNQTTSVTVTGKCFAQPHAASDKNLTWTNAAVSGVTFNKMTIAVPPAPDGLIGDATLVLFNSDGAGPVDEPFKYLPTGSISVGPTSGPIQGATQITIQGGPFPIGANAIGVTVGGVPATGISCPSSTTCTAYTPAHDPGNANVVVTIQGVQQTAVDPFLYVGPYITSVLPNYGPISGGTQITVLGTNMADTSETTFLAPATVGGVSVGNVLCTREGLYDASCTFTTPAQASVPTAPVDVAITITHTTGTKITTPHTIDDEFTYTPLAAMQSLYFGGGSAIGGATVTGTVVLDGYPPLMGASPALTLAPGAPTGVVSFPSSVPIAAGHLSATFPITVIDENFTGSVKLRATYGGTTVTGTLDVTPTPPPTLAPVGTLCAGQQFLETVTLSEPAPPGGVVLNLASNNSAASVPATVVVPANASSAQFYVDAGSPASAQTVSVTANVDGIASSPVTVTVLPASAVIVTFPTAATGGTTASGTVGLCRPAPTGGALVALSSSNPAVASVEATASILQGATSAPISVSTAFTSVQTSVTITATYAGVSGSSILVVKPPVAPPKCPTGETLCTCPNGTHACLSNSTQCLTYCK
jgi:hypothetical protein